MRLSLTSAALFTLLTFSCGGGAETSTRAPSAARASLQEASEPGSCIARLKDEVYAGRTSIEAYEQRALSECGIDFNAPVDSTKGAPSTPEPVAEPSPEAAAAAACANAVKAEVLAGTLPPEAYEATLAARCSP